jgi:hypothetical protein
VNSNGDLAAYCAIYQEMVDDIEERAGEIGANQGDDQNEQAYLDGEDALELYFDRLVAPAPPEIRPTVEALAAMSLRGFFSTPEGLPEAEGLFGEVITYAQSNCSLS